MSMPNLSANYWVTLFDDMEDDNFDGNLGEDDDELPRIYCNFEVIEQKATPQRDTSAGLPGRKGARSP